MSLPSVAQMVNRSNSGHHRALRAYRYGGAVLGPAAFDSEVRGMRIVLATLRRWQCVSGDEITTRGEELLAALDGERP